MDDFPTLETDRLRLRKPAAKDIPWITEYANNPKIAEMTLNIPHPYQEKDAISWLDMANRGFEDQSHFVFAVCLQSSDEFIGGMGLKVNKRFNRAELGFWIAEPFWGNGYATEAAQEVIKFGFKKVGIHKVFASHFENNPASGKVMAKIGMVKEARLVDHIRKEGKYYTLIQYRTTKKEFRSKSTFLL